MADGPEKCEDLESKPVEEGKVEEPSAEEEAAQLREKLLRLTAEFDNFRKRSVREKEEYRKFAVEQIIIELLEVYDNFERALESAKQTDDIDAVITGVEMVFKQFTGILEKEGLEKIECHGAEFDPHLHEAMMHVEHPDHDENTVVDVCKPGYCLHTKVIRPAMVTVSKKPEE
ncbi:nucleotide exchange factor GrpE [Methanolobus bombayensis]|uniref:nucleotide exchange factor GrpE n=1 Tax=Methanolobus bombayensis TaxID=38023 RepID=UPI001AE80881|nr:nucleotide exchange factor GrpE [Methanolobus bombayensis]MBP1908925.1 molecular chaperone GrpE [Methanolobus bombayensis]